MELRILTKSCMGRDNLVILSLLMNAAKNDSGFKVISLWQTQPLTQSLARQSYTQNTEIPFSHILCQYQLDQDAESSHRESCAASLT